MTLQTKYLTEPAHGPGLLQKLSLTRNGITGPTKKQKLFLRAVFGITGPGYLQGKRAEFPAGLRARAVYKQILPSLLQFCRRARATLSHRARLNHEKSRT